MKIQVLGCCQGKLPGYYTTAFLLNDHILLDAGEIAELFRIEEQYTITDVLLTHAHLDHIAGLPFLGDIIFGGIKDLFRLPVYPKLLKFCTNTCSIIRFGRILPNCLQKGLLFSGFNPFLRKIPVLLASLRLFPFLCAIQCQVSAIWCVKIIRLFFTLGILEVLWNLCR